MYQRIEEETSEYIFKARLEVEAPKRIPSRRERRRVGTARARRQPFGQFDEDAPSSAEFATRQAMGDSPKVGRNEPCPCGSGMKYKKCHGR